MRRNARKAKVTPEAGARRVVREYRVIREDYAFDADIMSEEPDRIARVKWIIQTKLSEADRTLILMYTDCQSLRKLAARLGISHTLLAKHITRIRKFILAEYDKLTNK